MKPRVYIETTIPSYLTAWPSRDLIRAAQQQLTKEWWARRHGFELFVSGLVLKECEAGDPEAAADRLAALTGIPTLAQNTAVEELAAALVESVQLPQKASSDAVHIALSSVHGLEYLLTWNCRHISNAVFRPRIEAVCRAAGFEPPLICSPDQLKLVLQEHPS
jgi:hypothetical protein